ncbi:hypothetical protein SEUCBS139899_005082 [Sporothrix eucalyptigena]|uniref:Uncharacterized protein n=1 Tax=Sporothrix eucalyptigena TaxID=1812306 RepID=A0ABP0C9C0_9PEZI
MHWECSEDSSVCVYGFSIAEETADGLPSVPSFCHFTIRGEIGESVVRSSFIDVPCEESNNYRCSASWSNNGYMVLTIDNAQNSRRAYFGINDSEIEERQFSATHHSPAYAIVPSAATEAVIPPSSNIHPRDYVDEDAKRDEDLEDPDGDKLSDEGSGPAAPQQYTIYEDTSYHAYVAEPIEASTDSSLPVPDAPSVNVDVDNSDMSSPLETSVQDVDDASVSGAAVDTPAGLPVDASIDTPVDTDSAQVPSETTQNAIPQQFQNIPDSDDALAATYQDSDAGPAPSGPVYSDGLPTVPEAPLTWALRNVTRDVFYNPNAVSVNFMIDVLPDSQAIPCDIKVDLDENVEPMFASWFVQKCENSDWYMSWGYNQMTDSAVATLIK